MVITYGELYLKICKALSVMEDSNSVSVTARDLICTLSGKTTEDFLLNRNESVPDETTERIENGAARLMAGEPLAYILGEWEFYGIPLYVTRDVLIPRDDTCAVAELAINQSLFLGSSPRILDLCCGSGCIGIAVASRVPDARITLADISKEALNIAKKNVARNKLGGRISCISMDAKKEPPSFVGKFDLIVSNPPYVTETEMQSLPSGVAEFEPHLALFGGEDGLDFYRSITQNYFSCLKPGGFLCFEFGMNQGDDVCRILQNNGYTVLERKIDYNGRERAVLAQRM